MAGTFYSQLGIKGKITLILTVVSYALQFFARSVIGDMAGVFGTAGLLFGLLTILFYITGRRKGTVPAS